MIIRFATSFCLLAAALLWPQVGATESPWHLYCQGTKGPGPKACLPTTHPMPALALGREVGNFNEPSRDTAIVTLGFTTAGNLCTGIMNDALNIAIADVPVPSYPRTAAEIARNIMPVTFAYPAGNPLRYMTEVQIADVLAGGIPSQDVTAALQVTLNLAVTPPNASNYAVYWPPGHYRVKNLNIPLGKLVDIGGAGRGTVLYGTPGEASPMLAWNQPTCCHLALSHIHDISFEGNGSTANMLSLIGISNAWLDRAFFHNVPVGFDAIFVNGSNRTYIHEVHIRDVEVVQDSAFTANAAIEFGPFASDSDVDTLIMEGNFRILYGIELDRGVSSIAISNSHLSNISANTLLLVGNNTRVSAINNYFDNSNADIVSIGPKSTNIRFVADRFFNVKSGFSGISVASSSGVTGSNLDFAAASNGAAAMVTETGTSNSNTFSQIQTAGKFANPAVFVGLDSSWRMNGADFTLAGVSPAQAENTTMYIGNGGAQPSVSKVEVPLTLPDGVVRRLSVQSTSKPGGSNTYTATVLKNGAATSCVTTITSALLEAQAGCFVIVGDRDKVAIQIVSSATAKTSDIRASLTINE